MSQTFRVQTHQFTTDDVAFVRDCLAAYFARLPRALRTAVACPVAVAGGPFGRGPYANLWPLTAPGSLWDEPPDARGLVAWRPAVKQPSRSLHTGQ